MQHVEPSPDCVLPARECMQTQVDRVLDNFAAVLACGGKLLLRDSHLHALVREPLNWQERLLELLEVVELWCRFLWAALWPAPPSPPRPPLPDSKEVHLSLSTPSPQGAAAEALLAALDAPLARTVLALGVLPSLLEVLPRSHFEVLFADPSDALLEAAFARGGTGIVLNSSQQLPFADIAFDTVVVGRRWCWPAGDADDGWLGHPCPPEEFLAELADPGVPALCRKASVAGSSCGGQGRMASLGKSPRGEKWRVSSHGGARGAHPQPAGIIGPFRLSMVSACFRRVRDGPRSPPIGGRRPAPGRPP